MYFQGCGQSFSDKFFKKTLLCTFPIVNVVRFKPPRLRLDPNLGGQWGQKRVVVALQPHLCDLAKNLKKIKSTIHLLGVDYIFGPVIQIWKDLGAYSQNFLSTFLVVSQSYLRLTKKVKKIGIHKKFLRKIFRNLVFTKILNGIHKTSQQNLRTKN